MYTIPTLERPKWTIQRQTAIVLRDASASMAGAKATEAQSACVELVNALGNSKNKGAFDVAIIDFSSDAHVVCQPTAANQMAVPDLRTHAMTDITKALIEAEKIAAAVPNDQSRPVCILLTDGGHNGIDNPIGIADRLKLSVDIVTVAFGDDADENLLRQIASSAQHHYRCRDGGDELRMFFSEVGTTLSVALNTGANPSVTLGQLHSNPS